jgi:outer membrane protein TolC
LILALSLAGCSVGLDYLPEAAPTPTRYKELKGWKLATPRDWVNRGNWWTFYRDPKLAFLIKQVEISNQTVAAAAASYEQARALIREAQASLFPTVTANYSYTRTRTGPAAFGAQSSTGSLGTRPRGAIYTTTFVPQLSGSWDLDVWGKVRRQIESNTSAAQASAADLDNAKLSAQSALAIAFFNLRAADALRELLDRTVMEYK